MIVLVFFAIACANVVITKGNFPIQVTTPESCALNEYFDPVCLACKRCGEEKGQAHMQQRDLDGSCLCKSKYRLKERTSLHNISCVSCPDKKVPSISGSVCLSCDETNPYNATLNSCEPCGGIFVENKDVLMCVPCSEEKNNHELSRHATCSDHATPSPQLCLSKDMVYSGGQCLPAFEYSSSLFTIKFENGVNVTSAFFTEHLKAASYNCEIKHNATACQVLANMCVMIVYKLGRRLIDEDNACSKFLEITKKCPVKCQSSESCLGLWLYYSEDATSELKKENVPNLFTSNINSPASKLNIVAMKYDLHGKFLGMSSITSDDLHICPKADSEVDFGFIFGSRVERNCRVNLQDLWDSSELIFYDLFLEGDNKTKYPIPILIRELRETGELVNAGNTVSKWRLVRRFFLSDHISGIEVGSSLTQKHRQPVAKVFRYVSDVSLKITLRTGKESGSIYPPLLIISYSEAKAVDYMKNKKVTVKFSVSYEMDQSATTNGIAIAIGILSLVDFAWSCIQTWSWFRRSGKQAIDLLTLGKLIIFMCGNVATVIFVVLFCACLNWLLFFKKQDVMHLLLPTIEQEKFLSVYLGIAFAMKAIQVIHMLRIQCTINIFFIDWERPRCRAPLTSSRAAASSKAIAETSVGGEAKALPSGALKVMPDKISSEMTGVSIWRTYFAANEWSEIQSKRKISLSVQLFGVLFFLKVLNFESFALAGPSYNLPYTEVNKYVPYSTCCRFAIGAAVYVCIALIQMIIRKGIYERFIEDKLQQYVDLCSVSNVSVFILVTKRFGYYIHGRSTHGRADVNMKEMHEFLRREEEDLCGHRGLLPNTEQQTFQMVLPSGVYDQFLRLLVPLTAYSQAADRMQGVGGRLAKVDIDRVANTHHMLNKFLSGFIEHAFKDLDYIVKDKVFLENLLDIELYETDDRGYFYNDEGHSYSSVLFYGNEGILLLFDVLLFVIVDIASTDYVLSAFITFVVGRMIQAFRQSAGRRNLVRKALVDERFLT